MEKLDVNVFNSTMTSYYVIEDPQQQKSFSTQFHPAFIIYHKILLLLQEFEKINNCRLTDRERKQVLSVATNNFEILEKEQYNFNSNDIFNTQIPHKNSSLRRLVVKILAKLEKTRESKSSGSALKITENTDNSNSIQENFKKSSYKVGLFKIKEDEDYKEYDTSEEEATNIAKFNLRKPDSDNLIKMDDYSSREKANGSGPKLTSKVEPLSRGKIANYNMPRGRDLLFSYNTQYGSGFGNYKHTKLGQYHQAYSRIEDKKKPAKKKQTATSLQRIEQSHQFAQMAGYNKISSNFSKNEFSTSVYDIETNDICLGKKRSSAMEVLEFAKMFK